MVAAQDGDAPLAEALASSQRLGMLGKRPIEEVIAHAEAFVAALPSEVATVIDVGSGGGVPGLVIAWRRPALEVVLVDRRASRTDHLTRLVGRLGLRDRVRVLTTDAMLLADVLGPGSVDAVVARGFGPPLVTAAAAAPLLTPDGLLIVSEPPEPDQARWPTGPLAELGLTVVPHLDARVRVLSRLRR